MVAAVDAKDCFNNNEPDHGFPRLDTRKQGGSMKNEPRFVLQQQTVDSVVCVAGWLRVTPHRYSIFSSA